MGQQFYDGTMKQIARSLNVIAALMTDRDRDGHALDSIRALLDGQHWSPDAIDEVARIVRGTGREIREPK
jgi:predicted transcriptional regulator